MALSAAQKTQVFKIFGIPERGSGFVIRELANPVLGPATDAVDFAAVVAELTGCLGSLSASQEAEVVALLAAWSAVGDFDEVKVTQDGAARGVLVDRDRRRDHIRFTLAEVLGFVYPGGGFSAEAARQGAAHRLAR